ncbi:MAG: ribosomal-protein-alanine N-acetyltransferase [Mesorhizobium sp.]|uniref:ribosomal protein S18-alanine N-acetyltransferase n=1 Tax=Mesorhizobium sp. TaxID=1871066 RepID=UPI000FE59C55|nr:ribosomal protein S18-alanine N-acetyltransferase [Mesorhizobium sp.]RWM94093.1 MAG: ribosomal-protein-alanine N-acetyltransferase [Mesorhizobium sp.]
MRIPFFQPRRRDYALEPLTVADSAAVAVLHREDFVRPWTDGEFAALLEQETVFGYAARETGQGAKPPVGFVLARLAAGEGEILTVAVARAHRRQGLGWQLIDAVLRELHAQRAEALFLEVDETNTPATALYRRLGFRQVGQRPNYYRSTEHGPTGALVMRRDLR